jgi:hypothetical protein
LDPLFLEGEAALQREWQDLMQFLEVLRSIRESDSEPDKSREPKQQGPRYNATLRIAPSDMNLEDLQNNEFCPQTPIKHCLNPVKV